MPIKINGLDLRQRVMNADEVAAPGQEGFVTPDVSKPADVSDDQSQLDSGVDWEEVLDGDDSAQLDDMDESTVAAKSSEDEPIVKPVVDEEVASDVAAPIDDDAAAAAVVADSDDFQPGEIDQIDPDKSPDEDWEKNYFDSRNKAVDEVRKRYEFTPEQKDEFVLNPENVLPQMAADLYVDVFESVLGAVNQMLPHRVATINSVSLQAAERTNEFYSEWPGLKTTEGEKQVIRIGRVYRDLNKNATSEEFIRDVGTQASIALGIPIPGVETIAATSDNLAPSHVPAGPGGVGGEAPIDLKQSDNQFERLNAEWDDDET